MLMNIKKNLPDRLFYKSGNSYRMFTTKDTKSCKAGAYLGKISFLEKPDKLYIAKIKSFYPQNKELKVGTSLVNFAKKMSERLKFGGKLETIAANYTPNEKEPHKFFWKQGFRTGDASKDELLEFVNEYNIDVPYNMKQGLPMFFDPRKKV